MAPAKLPDGPTDTDELSAQFEVTNFVSRYPGGYVMEPSVAYDELVRSSCRRIGHASCGPK